VRASGAPRAGGGAPPPPPSRAAAPGAKPSLADALAASGPAVTAEALRVKRGLEKEGVKTYFAAVSPFPPPAGAVLGAAGGGGGGGGGGNGAAAVRGATGLSDSKMKGSLQASQSLGSSKLGAAGLASFTSKAGGGRK
jgi:hypothetical protein